MYKHILLAADGSENSLRAAKQAAEIASLVNDCMVEVLYVADFSHSKDEILHAHGKEELELKRLKKLIPIEEILKSDNVQYRLKIIHGDPGPAIVEYANKGSFDLVVIGGQGRNALQEMVLGSVSHKVIKRVHSPVLVVK